MRPYAVGIDLGTTYTAAAVWRDGRAETVSLGGRSLSIPSVLFLRTDGVFLIGDAAVQRGIGEPERFAQDFKGLFGEQHAPMVLGDEEFKPAALMGHLLRWVVEKVVEREDGPPEHVTLTCPATWGDYRRNLLKEAAETAKLTSVGLLVEPVAAAVYYASQERMETGEFVAVYDLGGGTFDATIVEKTEDGFRICGSPVGTESIGGRNFDGAVMHHVEMVLKMPWRNWDQSDPVVLAGLASIRAKAIEAKELMSSDTEATVPVMLPDLARNVRITRAEFESAIRLLVYKTITLLLQAVDENGIERSDLSAVLLIGGSSSIPLVSQLLSAEIGVPIKVDAHPKYAVCLGAAVSSSMRLPASSRPTTVVSTPVTVAEPPPSALIQPDVGEPQTYERPEPRRVAAAAPPGQHGEGAELLVPDVEAPLVLDVAVGESGIRKPVDVEVEVTLDELEPTPVVSDVDEPLRAEYSGQPDRGWRIVAAVSASVVVLVAVTIVAVVITSGGGSDLKDGPKPTVGGTKSPAAVGASVTLLAEQMRGAEGATMSDVARSPSGATVAVGSLTTPASDSHTPRVWFNGKDGWKVVFDPGNQLAAMNGVAAGGKSEPMFVAVGWRAPAGKGDPPPQDRIGSIWTSKNGRVWTPVTAPPMQELFDVAAVPGGGFVATGLSWAKDPDDGDAVILTSSAGTEWRVADTQGLSGPGPITINRLLPGADGSMLAIGRAQRGSVMRSVMWSSKDGADWQSSSAFESSDASTATAGGLMRLPNGQILVVGSGTTSGGDGVTSVWTVEGGDTVLYRPSGTDGRLSGVVQTPGGIVAVGEVDDNESRSAAAWTVRLG